MFVERHAALDKIKRQHLTRHITWKFKISHPPMEYCRQPMTLQLRKVRQLANSDYKKNSTYRTRNLYGNFEQYDRMDAFRGGSIALSRSSGFGVGEVGWLLTLLVEMDEKTETEAENESSKQSSFGKCMREIGTLPI
ncbi:unnamed protein product [Litomosoides sigmodontis]|uniref:Uncharacterized protein n=1 Tax=Litomosoides sigmodontis TaxID=42156 RepID=A0A3P6UL87_LITSI|nr:unnamed protein product [Litomosoides sigmodontis]